MRWVVDTFSSSIGKKLLMAVTGLGFLGFLAGHLLGNLTVYWGAAAFVSYAEHLHALEPLVQVAEMGLLTFLAIHVTSGAVLFFQNRSARGGGYAMKKWAGGRTVFSATMPYTGLLILLFVVVHLVTFRFNLGTRTVFEVAVDVFRNPFYMVFYTLSMAVVAFHVAHGLWSAFQTLGLSHPKYMPAIRVLSMAAAVVVLLGFGMLPTVILLMA